MEKLSTFERIIVELLRAVIMGYHLIVLDEVGALVSDDELKKLHGIIRRYVKKGFSFFAPIFQAAGRHVVSASSKFSIAAVLQGGKY